MVTIREVFKRLRRRDTEQSGSSRIIEISGSMKDFESAVIGTRGRFYIDVMHVVNPSSDQTKLFGMIQLGLRYADSAEKIDQLKNPIDELTGMVDLISKGKKTEPFYNNWQKCEKKSPYSFSQTYFWR